MNKAIRKAPLPTSGGSLEDDFKRLVIIRREYLDAAVSFMMNHPEINHILRDAKAVIAEERRGRRRKQEEDDQY